MRGVFPKGSMTESEEGTAKGWYHYYSGWGFLGSRYVKSKEDKPCTDTLSCDTGIPRASIRTDSWERLDRKGWADRFSCCVSPAIVSRKHRQSRSFRRAARRMMASCGFTSYQTALANTGHMLFKEGLFRVRRLASACFRHCKRSCQSRRVLSRAPASTIQNFKLVVEENLHTKNVSSLTVNRQAGTDLLSPSQARSPSNIHPVRA
jgi:hypothetical protein